MIMEQVESTCSLGDGPIGLHEDAINVKHNSKLGCWLGGHDMGKHYALVVLTPRLPPEYTRNRPLFDK